jgi:hypothetical protein
MGTALVLPNPRPRLRHTNVVANVAGAGHPAGVATVPECLSVQQWDGTAGRIVLDIQKMTALNCLYKLV